MKRLVSLLMAVVLIFSLTPAISADTLPQGEFSVYFESNNIYVELVYPREKIDVCGIEFEVVLPSGFSFNGNAKTPLKTTGGAAWNINQSSHYAVGGRYAKKMVIDNNYNTAMSNSSTSVVVAAIPVKFASSLAPGDQTVTINVTDIAIKSGSDYVSGLDYFESASQDCTFKYYKSIAGATVSGITNMTYNGSRRRPVPTVKIDGVTLQQDEDYRATYTNDIKCGLATVTIIGAGNYTGKIVKNYYIIPETIKGMSRKSSTVSGATITWNKSSNASGYYVYRSLSKDSGYTIVKTLSGKDSNTYADSGLASGTKYYYKVSAYITVSGKNVAGALTSSYLSCTTAGYTISKPSSLKVSAKTSSTVTLKWKKSSVTNESVSNKAVGGYYVYRSTSKDSGFKKIATINSGDTVTYKDKGLSSEKTYYYRVYAFRTYKGAAGSSPYAAVTAKTDIKVSTPKSLKIASNTTSSIKLSWKKVSKANGYYIYRSTKKSSGYKKIKTITKGSTVSYTNKSLSAGKTYYYRVIAYRTSGGKKYKSEKAQITACTKPKAPKVTLKKASSTSIKVTSKKVTGASGYQVYYSTKKSSGYKKAYSGKKTTYTKKSLKKGKKYYVKVRAYKTVNGKKYYSSYSSVKSIKL